MPFAGRERSCQPGAISPVLLLPFSSLGSFAPGLECNSERMARRRVLCYKAWRMMKRLMLAVCLLAALFVSAVRLPASSCPVLSAPIGRACKQGSCPNKACCSDAEKNKSLPTPPLAKDDSASQQLFAIVAPSLTTCLLALQAAERSTDLSAHRAAHSATPKRVLLCTFLI